MLAVLLAVTAVDAPALAAGLVALVVLPFVATNPRVRASGVCLGTLLVFQSSDQLTPPKLAVLAIVVLSAALGFSAPSAGLKPIKVWTLATAGILAVLSARAIVFQNHDPTLVVRDVAPYVLLLLAPLVAKDFARNGVDWLRALTVVVGVFGAVGFIAAWATKRGYANLPALGLPSSILVTLGVSVCAANAVTARRSWPWWFVTVALISASLATGTRNMLINVLAPIVILVWARRRSGGLRRKARRSLKTLVVVGPFAAAVAVFTLGVVGFDTGQAFDRVATVFDLDAGDGSTASIDERRIQDDAARTQYDTSPILGGGPGHQYLVYRPTSNTFTTGITIDSSLSVPAKWGIVGTVALLGLLWSWWQFLRPRKLLTFWSLVTLGVAPVLVLQSLLTNTLEDKGLPLVLFLLGAGTLAERRARDRDREPVDA